MLFRSRRNQPRKVVDLIQTIGKALVDHTDLGSTGAIKNPLVVRSLESKLPEGLKKDWLMFMVDPSNDVTEDKHFDMPLAFLKKQEEIFERAPTNHRQARGFRQSRKEI